MSLSGNLGFVPIDEVLRLLTRSKQQGAVDVTGEGLRGRVFVGRGGIDLATTSSDTELHRHLVNSGFADERMLSRVTSAETTLAAIGESNQALIALLREMTVESLHQIAERGGDFEVHEGLTTPYASPKSFDLEALLQDAEDRRREWATVAERVPDLSTPLRFRRDLGDREEVTIKVDQWKVLSEIGNGASISEIADRLGTTEFWTARTTAHLVDTALIMLESTSAPVVDSEPVEPELAEMDDGYSAQDDSASDPEPVETVEPVEHESAQPVFAAPQDSPEEDVDPSESWWQEPQDEQEPVAEEGSAAPEVVSEGLSEIPAVEDSHDEDDEVDGDDVEGDTEAFLERVFSELETSEPEAEEGHGLLRRRRMGTLRDFSSDS
ncbi:MAG TPA: DUF4388 domain-containing protein [Acidimicrobiia bacterium]|nr:DUF4388 domain-containing protein [Acidimicrobiia bacterium]